MSYSYIKSVFPNFENSNKVYDETLYTNINSSLYNEASESPQVKPLEYNNKKKEQEEIFNLPSNKLLENLTNIDQDNSGQFQSQMKNNLSYYNLPLKSQMQTPLAQTPLAQTPLARSSLVQNESKIEIPDTNCDDCDVHVKHILDCKQCKMLAVKQLGIESDKYRNEEMMELASYVIFGMFILLLIDSLKKDK
jgi:hypothetical protein